MNLYILRHAHAAALEDLDLDNDADRPLTEKGHQQIRLIVEAVKKLEIPLQAILSSPYLRARETAEGVCSQLDRPGLEVTLIDKLTPGSSSKKLSRELIGREEEHVMIVGHEPDLSEHCAWLIGSRKATIKLSKASLANVYCEVAPGQGMGELKWLLTPKLLESLLEIPVAE